MVQTCLHDIAGLPKYCKGQGLAINPLGRVGAEVSGSPRNDNYPWAQRTARSMALALSVNEFVELCRSRAE